MDGKEGTPCGCDMCRGSKASHYKDKAKDASKTRTSLGRQASSRPTREGIVKGPRGRPPGIRGRPPLERGPIDDDGLPDHLIRWFTLLKSEGQIDRDLRELPSLEHHLENAVLASTMTHLATYPPFAPRVGELVLWYRNLDGELQRDPGNGHYKIYDPNTRVFKGYPKWLGGVITQIPISSEPVMLEDIEGKTSRKLLALNNSGFRVECLPDVNSEDKSLTKQYSHVPLSYIRPLGLWQDLIPTEHVLDTSHPSLKNVLRTTRTINLVGKYKLVGIWPDAYIFAKGLFLGAECHWADDVVRLYPRDGEKDVTEVMRIHAFILSLQGLQPEPDDNTTVTGDRCESIHILVRGQVYTHRQPKDDASQPVDPSSLPEDMHAYGPWYPSSRSNPAADASSSSTTPPSTTTHYNLPAVRILSRLLSLASLTHLHPSTIRTPQSPLNIGLPSLVDARHYALMTDHRLKTNDTTNTTNNATEKQQQQRSHWHWTDTRAEALDIETFNGIDVGERYDRERDVARMQHVLEVLKREKGQMVVVRDEGQQVGPIAPMVALPSIAKGRTTTEVDEDEDEGDDDDDFARGEEQHGTKKSGMVMASSTAAAAEAVQVISSDDDDEEDEEGEEEGEEVRERKAVDKDDEEEEEEQEQKEIQTTDTTEEREAKRMRL